MFISKCCNEPVNMCGISYNCEKCGKPCNVILTNDSIEYRSKQYVAYNGSSQID